MLKGYWNGGRHRVSAVAHGELKLFLGNLHAFAKMVQHVFVGLVKHKQVDVLELHAGLVEQALNALGHCGEREIEDLGPFHKEIVLTAKVAALRFSHDGPLLGARFAHSPSGNNEVRAASAVGSVDKRPDQWGRHICRSHKSCCCGIAKNGPDTPVSRIKKLA